MNLFRNRLIIGFLFRLVTGTVNLIYKIIKLLNLHLALLVIMLGFILFVIAKIEPSGAIFTIFIVALFLSILYSVFGTVRNLLGLNKKPKKKRGAQLVKEKRQQQPQIEEQPQQVIIQAQPQYVQTEYQQSYIQPAPIIEQSAQTVTYQDKIEEKPVYFRTKQNPDYVFAEYSDRYELFKISQGKLVKVRTDYK